MRSKQSVALSEANAHHQFLHEDLARSGLTPKDIDVEPLPATSRDVGYTIKYPGHDGMWRRRFKNKEPKYTQPKDQHGVWVRSMEAYDEWQHAPYRLIVEGEKKAAAAIKHLGLPAVGIGGCWNWSTGDGVCNRWLESGSGTVAIVMDGDLASRKEIQEAAGGLARALLAVNTPVEVVLLPAGEHDHKVGLDDWLMTGKRLKDFRKLPRFPIEDLPKTKREVVRELGLMLGDKGKVLANYSNTLNYLEHQHAADLYTDQYLGAFFKGEPYRDEVHDSLLLRELEELNPAWPRRHVEAARRQLLATNTRNGIGEWLEGLVWDGKARLSTFFTTYCAAPEQDPAYLADAARSVFVGMVARCLKPGCKFDLLTTLVGPQGVGKTSLWEELAGGPTLCKDAVFTRDNDNLARIGANAWVVNLDEFAGMSKADARDLKNWLTRTSDTWVPKYVELSRTKERAFIVVGTTNEIEHLSDTTGNRRFLPVQIGTVDFARLRRDRGQLFAEAVRLFKDGYIFWEVQQAFEAQENHRQQHPWERVIRDFLATSELPKTTTGHRFVTLQRVLWEVRSGLTGNAQQDEVSHLRAVRILRMLKFERRLQRFSAIEKNTLPKEEKAEWWFSDRQMRAERVWVWRYEPTVSGRS